ncbi:hypothetical protein [Paracoccus lutimaris]|uniref:hypothetical protein n=1 Tax=Paracoccus lutimaris TaxID=1490030 RepID=UPI000DF202A6|nr:hypothetical protein [Paracoccus lutimaris]
MSFTLRTQPVTPDPIAGRAITTRHEITDQTLLVPGRLDITPENAARSDIAMNPTQYQAI